MGFGLGTLAKAAFRLEGKSVSGTGMASTDYPQQPDTVSPHADEEEVLLKGSDLIPLLAESLEEEHQFELDETLNSSPAIGNMDRVALLGGGSVDVQGTYEGLDQLIAAAMGYEDPRAVATGSPIYVSPIIFAV